MSAGASRRAPRALALVLAGALLAVQALFGALAPAGACACGAFIDPVGERTDGSVLQETAVLSLREGTQTVVMGLQLDQDRAGAALLMPTPTVPEVSAALAGTLREIAAATAPREVVEFDLWGSNPFLAGSAGPGEGGAPGSSSVTVHEESRVGDYEVAVLGGEAAGVRDWLAENGYELSGSIGELIDPYAEDGWTFTAVRYAADAELDGDIDPLRFDFPAQELVYPVRFSQAATEHQSLRIFVIGEDPVRRSDDSASAQQVDRPWVADPTLHGWSWSDATLRELVGIDDTSGEMQRPVVTEFDIYAAPSTFTSDITFTADPEAERVVPTVTVRETVTLLGIPVGIWLVAAGVLTLLSLLLAVVTVIRSRSRRS